jgi:predicted dehydrogenase
MRIGIVGAENSHTAGIAKALNVEHVLPGIEVTHVWGETAEFAAKAAATGQIPNIVADYTEMIGKVDGVGIDHRDGKYHLAVARQFVEAGLPVFVDKPFCTDLAEGVEFARFAKAKGVPVTTFSTQTLQQSTRDFFAAAGQLGPLRSVVTAGPCDVDDVYGGVFFYAIHQVEPICVLLNSRPVQVTTTRLGVDGVATITFECGALATINCLQGWWGGGGFSALACGTDGIHFAPLASDPNTYLAGIKCFTEMFATRREPIAPAAYLQPIAVLQAMRESFATGRPADVPAVPEI